MPSPRLLVAGAALVSALAAVPAAPSPATAAAGGWTWSAAQSFSRPGVSGFVDDLAVSADGSRQTVLWRSDDDSYVASVTISRDFGLSWDDSARLSTGGQNAGGLKLAMSADGMNQSAVWVRAGKVQASGTSDAGATWSPGSNLPTNPSGTSPSIALGDTRRVAVWRTSPGTETTLASASDDSAQWTSPPAVLNNSWSDNPEVAIAHDGSQTVVAMADTTNANPHMVAVISPDGGANWTPVALTGSVALGPNPQVAVSQTGQRVSVAWLQQHGSGYYVHARSSDDSGQTWTSDDSVSGSVSSTTSLDLTMSSDGMTQVMVWWHSDGTYQRAQVCISYDAGRTWGEPITLSEAGLNASRVGVAVSGDGTRQTVVWQWGNGSTHRIQSAMSLDSGSTWSTPLTLSDVGTNAVDPVVAMSTDGSRQSVAWTAGSAPSSAVVTSALFTPPAPPPPAPVPPDPPESVAAAPGDAGADVSWSPPASHGSYPVTNYEVRTTPAGGSCLTAGLTCTITGLVNDRAYTISVRALNGAGWGPWSAESASITPRRPSIAIIGGRSGRTITVTGVTTGLAEGTALRPWFRKSGAMWQPGGRGVATGVDGSFTWSRKANGTVWLRFAGAGVTSNTVVVTPS